MLNVYWGDIWFSWEVTEENEINILGQLHLFHIFCYQENGLVCSLIGVYQITLHHIAEN
jgi:hypothetical protein